MCQTMVSSTRCDVEPVCALPPSSGSVEVQKGFGEARIIYMCYKSSEYLRTPGNTLEHLRTLENT